MPTVLTRADCSSPSSGPGRLGRPGFSTATNWPYAPAGTLIILGVAGICGGLAEYTGIDATLIRVVLLVATILGAGSLIVIYLICWLLIPQAPRVGVEPGQNP